MGATESVRWSIGQAVALIGCLLAGTAGVAASSGPVLGLWWMLTAIAVLAALVCPEPPRWSFVLGLSVLGLLAVGQAFDSASGRRGLVSAAAAAGLSILNWRWAEKLERWGAAVGARVASVVSALTFGALGTAALAVPTRHLAAEGWAQPSPNSRAARRRPGLWVGVAVVVVAAAIWLLGDVRLTRGKTTVPVSSGGVFSLDGLASRNSGRGGSWWDQLDGTPAPYAQSPWYAEYSADIEWVMNQGVAFRPLDRIRVADVRTRWVNVIDGRRATWAPPPCECRRYRVWIYGGSTTFGLGQRDEFTISSQLAKLAWDQGIAIDVENRGQPGDLHWQEAERFGWDVGAEVRPDLVIFYDGVNELWGTATAADYGGPSPAEPVDPLVGTFWRELTAAYESDPPPTPPGAELVPTTTAAPLSAVTEGSLAVERYDRSRVTSRGVAEEQNIPAVWIWQPSRVSRPAVDGEPENKGGEERVRAVADAARDALPSDVLDFSDVFDEVPRPLFTDDVHHNEEGAEIVAGRLLDVVLTELDLSQG
jgi:lysophospholipase L1-like esterase